MEAAGRLDGGGTATLPQGPARRPLEHFVETELMVTFGGSGAHQAYHRTKKGLDFKPVIIALTEWGDRWAAPDGPPIEYEHEGCSGRVRYELYCGKCGEGLQPQDVAARKTAVMRRLQEQRIVCPGRSY